MNKEIDIVDIKKAVKYNLFKFYVDNGYIYCENFVGEVVLVGEVE